MGPGLGKGQACGSLGSTQGHGKAHHTGGSGPRAPGAPTPDITGGALASAIMEVWGLLAEFTCPLAEHLGGREGSPPGASPTCHSSQHLGLTAHTSRRSERFRS